MLQHLESEFIKNSYIDKFINSNVTLTASDNGKEILVDSDSDITVNLPASLSDSYSVKIYKNSANNIVKIKSPVNDKFVYGENGGELSFPIMNQYGTVDLTFFPDNRTWYVSGGYNIISIK